MLLSPSFITHSTCRVKTPLGHPTQPLPPPPASRIIASGNWSFGLPLMTTLVAARWLGNVFNEGIYDLHITLRKWPLLKDHIPSASRVHTLRVCDIMAKPPLALEEVERAGTALSALAATQHNAFPVVFSAGMMDAHPRLGTLAGIISRKHLAVILVRKAFHSAPPTQPFSLLSNPTASLAAAYAISLAEAPQAAAGEGGGGKSQHRPTSGGNGGDVDSDIAAWKSGGRPHSHGKGAMGAVSAASTASAGDYYSAGGGASQQQQHPSSPSAKPRLKSPAHATLTSSGGGHLPPRYGKPSSASAGKRAADGSSSVANGAIAEEWGHNHDPHEGNSGSSADDVLRNRTLSIALSPSPTGSGSGLRRNHSTLHMLISSGSLGESAHDDGASQSLLHGSTAQQQLVRRGSFGGNSSAGRRGSGAAGGAPLPDYGAVPVVPWGSRVSRAVNFVVPLGDNGGGDDSVNRPSPIHAGGQLQYQEPVSAVAAAAAAAATDNGSTIADFPPCHSGSSSASTQQQRPSGITPGHHGPSGSIGGGIFSAASSSRRRMGNAAALTNGTGDYSPNFNNNSSIYAPGGYVDTEAGPAAPSVPPSAAVRLRMPSVPSMHVMGLGGGSRNTLPMPTPPPSVMTNSTASGSPGGYHNGSLFDATGGGGTPGAPIQQQQHANGYPSSSGGTSGALLTPAVNGPASGAVDDSSSGYVSYESLAPRPSGGATGPLGPRSRRGSSGTTLNSLGASSEARSEARFVADGDVLELLYTDEPLLLYDDFEWSYPHYPDASDCRLTPEEADMFIDLRPYLNPCPYTIHVHAPVERAFELFRALGLRHLVVVNDCHDVVGLITRHELLLGHLEDCVNHRTERRAGVQ